MAAKNQQTEDTLISEKQRFYTLPTSPATNLVTEILAAGDDIESLPDRKNEISHSTKLEVSINGRQRKVSLHTKKEDITIELSDIYKLTGNNKGAKKLLALALIKANEQALHDGELTRDYVSFPLQELVDIGFYSSIRSARNGFNNGMDTLTSLKIKGHIQQTPKKKHSIDVLEIPFTGARIKDGECKIFLNNRINWNFIIQYYTIIPRYYFTLSNRAGDLMILIFSLARQRTREIEKQGYFNISFKVIQHRLQLPSENNNKNPDRTIRQPIEDAIEEIETMHSDYYGNQDFALLPVYDDAASITDYLNNGYLKVSLTGAFADPFIAHSKKTTKQIEAAKKRQERIVDGIIIQNAIKKKEAEEKAKEGGEGEKPE